MMMKLCFKRTSVKSIVYVFDLLCLAFMRLVVSFHMVVKYMHGD